jgi:hypothetical protein
MSRCEELAEVLWHGLEVVRNQDATLRGDQCEDVDVSDAMQARDVRREEVNCRFAA